METRLCRISPKKLGAIFELRNPRLRAIHKNPSLSHFGYYHKSSAKQSNRSVGGDPKNMIQKKREKEQTFKRTRLDIGKKSVEELVVFSLQMTERYK